MHNPIRLASAVCLTHAGRMRTHSHTHTCTRATFKAPPSQCVCYMQTQLGSCETTSLFHPACKEKVSVVCIWQLFTRLSCATAKLSIIISHQPQRLLVHVNHILFAIESSHSTFAHPDLLTVQSSSSVIFSCFYSSNLCASSLFVKKRKKTYKVFFSQECNDRCGVGCAVLPVERLSLASSKSSLFGCCQGSSSLSLGLFVDSKWWSLFPGGRKREESK